jgi:hypothetical protein
MEPGTPSLQSIRLFDQVRERIGCQDYIVKIKRLSYLLGFFSRYSTTQTSGKRNAREIEGEVWRRDLAVATKGAQVVGKQHLQPLQSAASRLPQRFTT